MRDKDKAKHGKFHRRKDTEGNYWIGTMRFTPGTLFALGIVCVILSVFVAGIFYGNENFFDNFTCGELERYLMGDKMGYYLNHKDLPESQHLELHALVDQCNMDEKHLNTDSIPNKGIDFGLLGGLF